MKTWTRVDGRTQIDVFEIEEGGEELAISVNLEPFRMPSVGVGIAIRKSDAADLGARLIEWSKS